jgi:hypothetical protein
LFYSGSIPEHPPIVKAPTGLFHAFSFFSVDQKSLAEFAARTLRIKSNHFFADSFSEEN